MLKDNFKEMLMISLYESLSEEDKSILKRFQLRRCLINESIVDTLSKKGKEVLLKIASTAKNILEFLKKIKTELYNHLNIILTEGKNRIKRKLQADQNFVKTVKKHIHLDKNAFIKDIKTCHEVSAFYTDKFRDSILKSVLTSLHNLLINKKHNVVKESLAINVIDNLVKHLHKVPPFAWLDMVHHKGTEGAESIIKGLSYITHRLGGPAFTIPVMASILGLAFEFCMKGMIKHGLIDAAEIFSIPFVGLVVKTAGNVATFLACYELCKEISASIDKFEAEKLAHKSHHHKKH
jgi:hypothetical protein